MIRRAFTLVELLVVITIIGVLVALLLPAVNAARESGRRAQCANNVKQLGLACLQHEEAQGYFPSGGWGYNWVGDPTLGFGGKQPGSWFYSILPNLDNGNLFKLGGSVLISGSYSTAAPSTQLTDAVTCMTTALPMINCPSRRRAVLYPISYNGSGTTSGKYAPFNAASSATMLARGDYAANAGDVADSVLQSAGPATMGQASAAGTGLWFAATNWLTYYKSSQGFQSNGNGGFVNYSGEPNGVIYTGSQVRKDDITDGVSSTYLLGEKYLSPDHYTNGADRGDNVSIYSGCDDDNERSTYFSPPLQDRSGLTVLPDGFGGPHNDSCCFAFCDGSVHWIRYSIDLPTHQLLGQRNDAMTIDTSKL